MTDDFEYIGIDPNGKYIVREQLFPESRGTYDWKFETEQDAQRFMEKIR